MIRNSIDQVMRFAGDAANAALLVAFALATLRLYDLSGVYLAKAGGMPRPSLAYLERLALSPDAQDRILALLASWTCAVAALGCAWMTVLGLRWAYHGLMRSLAD